MLENDLLQKSVKLRERERFTIIDSDFVQKSGLPLEAIGLLTYFISLPPDWKVYTSQISKHFHIGRDRARSILRKLIDAGYVKRERIRTNGKYTSYVTYYNDYPEFREVSPETENPSVVNSPGPEKPGPGLPGLVNPPLQSKYSTEDLSIQNKPPIVPQRGTCVSHNYDKEFSEFYELYPKKVDKQKAKEVFHKIMKNEPEVLPKLMEGLRQQVEARARSAEPTPLKYVPGPAVWLRNARWEDQVTEEVNDERPKTANRQHTPLHEKARQRSEILTDRANAAKAKLAYLDERRDRKEGSIEGACTHIAVQEDDIQLRKQLDAQCSTG